MIKFIRDRAPPLLAVMALLFVSLPAYAGGRDGSGTMSIQYPNFQPGATISSSQVNTDFSQIVAEITNSWPRDGQAAPTANMPMNGFKLTGLGDGVNPGDSVNYAQLLAVGGVTASSVSTFTNKTYDTAGTGNVFKINGTTINAIAGTTSKVATVSGVLTSGHCASIDSNLNIVDAGGACTVGGGGGTVTSSTAGQIPYYASTGTAVVGNANLTISTGAVTIGQAGSVKGTLLLSGNTSGTTTLTPAAAASGVLTLPTATDTLVGKATTDTFTNKTYDTAGTGNVFKVNGTTVTTASDFLKTIGSTQGQILYYNGTIWTTLAPSTDGNVLTTHGGGANPTWSAPSSGMVLLSTVNASGAASVTFNASLITAAYNKYVIEYDSVIGSSASSSQTLAVLVSTDNGSSYKATSYINSPGASLTFVDALGNGSFAPNAVSASGTIKFASPSAASYCLFVVDSTTYVTATSIARGSGSGVWQGTTAINNIKIQWSGGVGTITGNFHLYGLTGT